MAEIRFYKPKMDAIIYEKPDDKSAKKGYIYYKKGGTVAVDEPPKGKWGKLTFHDGWIWLPKFTMINPDDEKAVSEAADRTTKALQRRVEAGGNALPNKGSANYSKGTGYNLKGKVASSDAEELNIPESFGQTKKENFYIKYADPDIEIPDDFGKINYYNNYDLDLLAMHDYLQKIHANFNIVSNSLNTEDIRRSMMHSFNRFRAAYPDISLSKTFGYVFFVRPDLNLYKNDTELLDVVEKNPAFHYANKNKPDLLKSLTNKFKSTHRFDPLLCNRASSFEVQDEYIKSEEIGGTFTGYLMKYGKNNIESKTAGSVNIQFQEDNELSVYRHTKHWIDYISNVSRGEFSPKKYYIRNKILDYATSMYYFLCGPDGESILFWSKYYGCFPITQPSSNFSYSKGNFNTSPEFQVTFEYMSKEDFNPMTIFEFNLESTQDNYNYKRTYDANIVSTGKSMAGPPFIETYQTNNDYYFKLKFRPFI